MKPILPARLLVISLLSFSIFACRLSSAPCKTKEDLISGLQIAIQNQNKNAVAAFFNWDGVDDDMKNLSMSTIDDLIKYPMENLDFKPLPSDFNSEFILDGTIYKPM